MKQVAQQEAERARFVVEKVSERVNMYHKMCMMFFHRTFRNETQPKLELRDSFNFRQLER